MQKAFYTIGYEGAPPDLFVQTLKVAGVKILLDVRAIPFSRKTGFSKTSLAAHLRAAEIEYLHLKALGNPDKFAKGKVTGGYRGRFEAHMKSEGAKADLKRAAAIAGEKTACLMCFERDPEQCHRLIVAGHLAALSGLAVSHLIPEKPLPLFD
jgi:uncharacterized protein (DUF488 family)